MTKKLVLVRKPEGCDVLRTGKERALDEFSNRGEAKALREELIVLRRDNVLKKGRSDSKLLTVETYTDF